MSEKVCKLFRKTIKYHKLLTFSHRPTSQVHSGLENVEDKYLIFPDRNRGKSIK